MAREIIRYKNPQVTIVVEKYPEADSLMIYPVGDLHYDATTSRRDLLRKLISKIKQEENSKLIVLGDTIDKLFFRSLVRGEQDISLNRALRELKALFEEIREDVLGIVEGNHDKGIEKETGFNIAEELAASLNVPFLRGQSILSLYVGKDRRKHPNVYNMLLMHGWGGGRKSGSKAQKPTEVADIWQGIDAVIMGHVHQSSCIIKKKLKLNIARRSIVKQKIAAVVAPSLLDYPIYAQEKGLEPEAHDIFRLRLSGKQKSITAHSYDLEEDDE